MSTYSELEALCALARWVGLPDDRRSRMTLPPVLDARAVRAHRLAPLAHQAGFVEFENDAREAALYAAIRERLLGEAGAALSQARVPYSRIKGMSLAYRLYERPALRPMGDMDLLVPAWRLAAAVEALERLGYRRMKPLPPNPRLVYGVAVARGERHAVFDLHHSILQPGRGRIDYDSIWHRSEPVGSGTERELSDLDAALIHFAHMGRHELIVPLINYVDGLRWLSRLGAAGQSALRLQAARAGVARSVVPALLLTETLGAGGSMPDWDLHCRHLPGMIEVARGGPTFRPLQLARKAVLVDSPRAWLELAWRFVVIRSIRLWHGQSPRKNGGPPDLDGPRALDC